MINMFFFFDTQKTLQNGMFKIYCSWAETTVKPYIFQNRIIVITHKTSLLYAVILLSDSKTN